MVQLKKRSKKLCVVCKDNMKNVNTNDASWVKQFTPLNERIGAPIHCDHFKMLERNNFPETFPLNSDMCVTIENPRHDFKKVFFFASLPVSLLKSISGELSTAEKAYGDYSNSGVVFLRRNKLIFNLRSPQPYLDNGIVYPRHLHYFDVHNPKKIYTIPCYPDHKTVSSLFPTEHCIDNESVFLCFERVLMAKHMGALCINALSEEHGDVLNKDLHIPHDLSIQKIKNKLENVPKHRTIVTYCYKPSCDAATNLIEKLRSLGYNNIFYFPGGIQERIDKEKIFLLSHYAE